MSLSDTDHKASTDEKVPHGESILVVAGQESSSDEEFLATLGYRQEVSLIAFSLYEAHLCLLIINGRSLSANLVNLNSLALPSASLVSFRLLR